MDPIILNKKQTKAIAQDIYGDVKSYCLVNMDRYFPWLINEIRKSKGKPPLEPLIMNRSPCDFCD